MTLAGRKDSLHATEHSGQGQAGPWANSGVWRGSVEWRHCEDNWGGGIAGLVFAARHQPAYPSTKQGQTTGPSFACIGHIAVGERTGPDSQRCIDKRGPGQSAQEFLDRHGERGGPLVDSDTQANWVSFILEHIGGSSHRPRTVLHSSGQGARRLEVWESGGVHPKHERHSSAIHTDVQTDGGAKLGPRFFELLRRFMLDSLRLW